MVDAYALVFAVLLLTGGLLGDRFGARRLFRIGLGLFALASLGCGAAPSAGLLIAMRALQGVGAAAMLPSSLALLNTPAITMRGCVRMLSGCGPRRAALPSRPVR